MSKPLLIVNARLVNEGTVTEADVRVKDGRIAEIGSGLTADGERVIDAAGRHLLPGMIDDQVHFREPGLMRKGDIGSESRAAVAGGITTFMEMPNTSPPTSNAEALEYKYQRAAATARANYAFYLGATNDNIDDVRSLDPKTACGIKVFMGASTGNMLVDDPKTLEKIFADAPTLVATHCEHSPTIDATLAEIRRREGDDLDARWHPIIRNEEACWRSSSFAVDLAKRHGTQLHVLHLTTARELELFEPGPIDGKSITAEACVHHLLFSDADYETRGNLIKCNPAIKTESDRAALVQGLKDDRLDIIATDHAPHTLDEKQTVYLSAAAGLPLVQHALQAALEHVARGDLSLTHVVEKVTHNPARRFKVRDRGFVREGYWADLTLVDLNARHEVTRDETLYKCGWSPFEGRAFSSTIDLTVVSGGVAYEDGRVLEGDGATRLEFDR